MKRYSLHLLLFVNAILALVLLWMWISPDGTLRNVRWQPPEPRKSDVAGLLPVLPAVGTADTRAFIAMLERPLFRPPVVRRHRLLLRRPASLLQTTFPRPACRAFIQEAGRAASSSWWRASSGACA